ncbi:MAG: glutathione S-transferase family protein [Pseudomonadota bacterium]
MSLPATIDKLTVYGDEVSGNCLKVRWIADRYGIDHDWVTVDVFAGDAQTDDFLAINPVGQVPLARWPDGRALPQSNAIMLYLAEQAGSDLIPTDPFKRAQMMSWLFWEQYSHEPYIAVRRARLTYRGLSEDELDPDLYTKGRRALGVMEMQLTYTDWLVGDAMTLADIALVAYTRVAHEGGFDLAEFPGVERWVSRTEAALGIPHAREAA